MTAKLSSGNETATKQAILDFVAAVTAESSLGYVPPEERIVTFDNDDRSLTIYIQHESPGKDRESNWLPAPEGDFRPLLRMYQPRPEALDGTYMLPPIRRVVEYGGGQS